MYTRRLPRELEVLLREVVAQEGGAGDYQELCEEAHGQLGQYLQAQRARDARSARIVGEALRRQDRR